VVVDNEQTGKLLLQKGRLKRRVTIIPLNKIARGVVDPDRMRKAKEVATKEGGKVRAMHECKSTAGESSQAIEVFFLVRPAKSPSTSRYCWLPFYAAADMVPTCDGQQVHLALELVGYEDELRAAMEYVFGSTLVCDSLSLAKSLTFHKNIRRRTVTLEGDVFDPSGTLTGGSKESVGTILAMLQVGAVIESTRREFVEDALIGLYFFLSGAPGSQARNV